ncbi:MAG: hypothetical protein ABI461_04020 [Polyangiaceae bacterium]
MSNTQHMLVRVIAVAVLVALHWFPHAHAAPLLATGGARAAQSEANAEHAGNTEPVGVATIP